MAFKDYCLIQSLYNNLLLLTQETEGFALQFVYQLIFSVIFLCHCLLNLKKKCFGVLPPENVSCEFFSIFYTKMYLLQLFCIYNRSKLFFVCSYDVHFIEWTECLMTLVWTITTCRAHMFIFHSTDTKINHIKGLKGKIYHIE